MSSDTTDYIISRPVNAYPGLPVHLSRRHVTTETVRDNHVERKVQHTHINWLGSFPTHELALGRQLVLEGKQ
jgi:hypothetical protein